MEFLGNASGNNGTLFSYVDLPLIFTHIESMGNPLIPDAEKHALRSFYSLNLKNGYVNANINL